MGSCKQELDYGKPQLNLPDSFSCRPQLSNVTQFNTSGIKTCGQKLLT
jgi:hypothetical protein